jgi:hypothetical protein
LHFSFERKHANTTTVVPAINLSTKAFVKLSSDLGCIHEVNAFQKRLQQTLDEVIKHAQHGIAGTFFNNKEKKYVIEMLLF